MSRKAWWLLLFPLAGLMGCDPVDQAVDEAVDQAVDEVADEAIEETVDEAVEDADRDLRAPPQVSKVSTPPDAQLVAPVATWRYLKQDQPTCVKQTTTDWTTLAFNDSTWSEGPAELGYGDGDEQTVIPFGPSATNKCITQYFRHTFTLSTDENSLYSSLLIRLLRDDGAAVYLNGVLVVQSNLPNGFTADTVASSETSEEDRFFQYPGIANNLQDGPNVIAVEVHQRSKTNPDTSMNLELVGVLGTGGPTRHTVRIPSKEATIEEAHPDTEFGLTSTCKMDGNDSDDMDQVCLAQWSLASIPPTARILAAHLDTNVENTSTDRYEVRPLTAAAAWVEADVTWNDRNGSASGDWVGGEFGPANLLAPVTVVNALNTGTKLITLPRRLVAAWLTTPLSNQGVAFFNTNNENGIDFSAGGEGLELVVTYEDP